MFHNVHVNEPQLDREKVRFKYNVMDYVTVNDIVSNQGFGQNTKKSRHLVHCFTWELSQIPENFSNLTKYLHV